MSDIKEVRVTASSMVRTRKTRKQAGGEAPLDTIGVMSASMKDAAAHASTAYGQTAQGVTPMSSSGTLTSQIIQPIDMAKSPVGSAVALAQTPMAGGAHAKQRVELKAPVHKTRVALHAPRKLRRMTAGAAHKTHRVRKIGIAMKKLGKKIKKAHKTAKKAASMSIDAIKGSLIKAGVLKGGSKAPETLLRKMYADLKTTSEGL